MVFYPGKKQSVVGFTAFLALQANAHVFVGYPPPVQWDIEIDKLIMPMNGDPNHDGSKWSQQPYPCKGHHATTSPIEPQVIWRAGEIVTFHVFDSTNTTGISMHEPGAAHSGGSCQLSISYDNGTVWNVVQSWEGNCVRVRKGLEGQLTNSYDTDQAYTFRLPDHLPSSDYALIAWTWLNASGNREFYMSCSTIKVIGQHTEKQPASGHPMLIANLRADLSVNEFEDWAWSRCNVPDGVWVRYPQRYIGMNPPIVASPPPSGSPIRYWNFDDADGFCGSDNMKLVQALALAPTSSLQSPVLSMSISTPYPTSQSQERLLPSCSNNSNFLRP